MLNLKGTVVLAMLLAIFFGSISCARSQQVDFDLAKVLEAKEIDFAKADFHGYQQFNFQLDDASCRIVQPKTFVEGMPWIWRARFWGHEPQLDIALLEKGWCVCYCDVSNLFGNDQAVKKWNEFHQLTQSLSLDPKPFLEGMSRGGLIVIRWAAANPGNVSGIYLDNAVLDMRSWPGGKGTGKGAEREWADCLTAYGITEAESVQYSKGPLDCLAPLATAQIPIIVLINEADDVVPPAENGDLLVAKYKQMNGPIKEIRRAGLGHHPHSLKDPAVLVEFATGSMKAQLEKATELKEEISVKRIWDESPHNAFTDIIRWNEKFYCTFRTGQRHVHGDDGKIQLIESTDGIVWKSVAHLQEKGIDLRDPKLSVTPNGRLMLLFGGSSYLNGELLGRGTRVTFLSAGEKNFGPITPVNIAESIKSTNDWLWRVTWLKETGFGIVYQTGGFHLVKTTNGIDYSLVKSFEFQGRPNESTVRFSHNDQMRIVVRNEETGTGHLVVSDAPYEEFTWHTIPVRLGGPNMVELPGGKWILGTREYSNPTKTILGELAEDGGFEKLYQLPSSGDTSYPGMLIHEDELWISYYASHEKKTSIYLARIPLSMLE